jgi:N-acetylglucosamine-6-phosphate deacetylase
MTRFALTGARLFDGDAIVDGHAVIVDRDRIEAVVPEADVPADMVRRDVEGLLAPGFIDVQVNGGGGALLNTDRSVEAIARIGAAHRRFGTTGFLPTLITDSRDHMKEVVAAAEAAVAAGVPGLLGLHLEGPFINPARKGAHPAEFIRPLDEDDIALLCGFRAGRLLVTLAPEMVPAAALGRLADAGVIISAGHTAASYDVAREARRAGVRGYTHLFNAMPPLSGREPGPVGAALDDPECWCGLIVDGQHVAMANLRVAIAAHGWRRMMLVTDAMSSVGSGLEHFDLLGRTVTRKDGRLTLSDGTLAGSDLDMATAVRNAVDHLALPVEAALAMASREPAAFLGLDRNYGRIAPGYRASLVLLDEGLDVTETWIDGVPSG